MTHFEEMLELINSQKQAEKSHWHTGIPTEEGWYLVTTNQADEYAVGYWDKTIQSFTRICFFDSDEVIAWMPIPPFEASKEK